MRCSDPISNYIQLTLPLSKGSPPLWSPPSTPQKLTPDSGVIYIDHNAARNPAFPLEPLFHALYAENPNFELGDIDLVTDRNNIRKLLRYVRASSGDAFQIRAELAPNGRTALFTRVEASATETIRGFRGYGHNFEKAYTKAERGSSAHHRVVGYDFGGMRCIVRHESDGYVDDDSSSSLSDALQGLSISTPGETGSGSAKTTVESGGRAVDSSSTLVIKTRAVGRELDMAEICCQLWASQTRKLAVAYHRDGVFDNVQLRDMAGMIYQWEMASQTVLGRLASLLKKIIGVAKRSGDRGALVDYDGGARLRIVAGDGKRALPEDLYLKWGGKEPRDADSPRAGHGDAAKLSQGDEIEGSSDRYRPGEDTTTAAIPMPKNTLFSEHIDYSVRRGLRQFFRRMPTNLPDYRALCGTLSLLPIDILAGRDVRDIMKDMRRGKADWDPDEGRVDGLKSLARDSAFRLVYLLLRPDGGGKAVDQNAAYNAVLFVVSHCGIFKYRTRKIVREAFEDRFNVSYKQRQTLNKWLVEPQEEGSDVTTEDEGFGFDSDSDYYFSD